MTVSQPYVFSLVASIGILASFRLCVGPSLKHWILVVSLRDRAVSMHSLKGGSNKHDRGLRRPCSTKRGHHWMQPCTMVGEWVG